MELFRTYKFDNTLKKSFEVGDLRKKWTVTYPMLFDEQDHKIANHQTQYHYYEWQAAINIFMEFGYLSLIEKYQFSKYSSQYNLFKCLVPESVVQLLHSQKYGNTQLPDLFVFSPDKAFWYFCEVKGNRDRERPKQSALFEELERLTDRPVKLIRFIT